MAKKETTNHAAPVLPMLKTVEQMSKVSGIGENKLRELMDNGELEYVQNGNRRLIADTAIWDWYERAKTAVKPGLSDTEILPERFSTSTMVMPSRLSMTAEKLCRSVSQKGTR